MVAEDSSIAYPEIQVKKDDDDEADQPIEVEVNDQEANIHSKSPGGISAFSGTTARASTSTQDLSYLNIKIMLEALADFQSASDRMLMFLIPKEISEASITAHMTQLQNKNSLASKNLTRLSEMMSASRDMYGSDTYIAPKEVLSTLVGKGLGSSDNARPWRPDALLQKANLAVLASSIFSQPWGTGDAQLIEELEQLFPMPFTEGLLAPETLLIGYSELANETFELALEIRTQCAIVLLARHAGQPNVDPYAELLQLFYEDGKTLRGWGILGLQAGDLTREFRDTILLRVSKLREAIARSEKDIATHVQAPIQSDFPWTTLVLQMVRWISLRLVELNRQISEHHGADRIFRALEEEVQRARLAKSSIDDDDDANDSGSPRVILEYDLPPEAIERVIEPEDVSRKVTRAKTLKLGQFRWVFYGFFYVRHCSSQSSVCRNLLTLYRSADSPKAVAAADYVKRLEATLKASWASADFSAQQNQPSTSDIQVTATAGPTQELDTSEGSTDESLMPYMVPAKLPTLSETQPDDDWQPQDGNDEPLQPDPEENLRQTTGQAFAMRAQRQAESNKENIGVSMSQQENLPGVARKPRLIDRQVNAQRLDEFNESQELNRNFQPSQMVDPSQDEGFQTQHVPADIVQRRKSKPAPKRSAPQPLMPERSSPKKARTQEVSRTSRPDIIRDQMNIEPSPSPMDEYRAANSSAKTMKAFQPKPPQIRKPWSEEETETLLALIEQHGTSWSLLLAEDKSEGMILQSRGQVALKDKARNMKMDYLK